MGKYKEMVMSARSAGITDEQTMWRAIDNVDALLEQIKESHPEVYWDYMRDAHVTLYGPHYDEKFAKYDVDRLYYTDREGNAHRGAHWTLDEIINATPDFDTPAGTTDWDEYVAYNAMYADLCKHFTDEQILQAAFDFFFNDEDWCDNPPTPPRGKVWTYMHSR